MKLLCCTICSQVFSLSYTYTECKGGHCGGQYLNNIAAKVWGEKGDMFVLGFANSSLTTALRAQLYEGDSKELMPYAGSMTPKGREFTAFIIPEAADSVMRVAERFDPIPVR